MKYIIIILTFITFTNCRDNNIHKKPKQVNYYLKSYSNGNYKRDSIPKYFDMNSDIKNLRYSLNYNSKGELTDSILKKSDEVHYKFEYKNGVLMKRIEIYKGKINSSSDFSYDDLGRLKEVNSIQDFKSKYDIDIFSSKLETTEKVNYSKNGNDQFKNTFLNGKLIKSEIIKKDDLGRVIEKSYKEKSRKLDLVTKYKYLNEESKVVKEINRFRNGNEFYEKETYSYDKKDQLLLRQVSASSGFVNLKQKVSKSGKEYDQHGNITINYRIMNKVLIIEHFENIY